MNAQMTTDLFRGLEFWIKEAEEHEHEVRYGLDQLRCDIADIKKLLAFYEKKMAEQEKPHSERDWS